MGIWLDPRTLGIRFFPETTVWGVGGNIGKLCRKTCSPQKNTNTRIKAMCSIWYYPMFLQMGSKRWCCVDMSQSLWELCPSWRRLISEMETKQAWNTACSLLPVLAQLPGTGRCEQAAAHSGHHRPVVLFRHILHGDGPPWLKQGAKKATFLLEYLVTTMRNRNITLLVRTEIQIWEKVNWLNDCWQEEIESYL